MTDHALYSEESYRAIINAIASSGNESNDFINHSGKGVILRHDVDYCLTTAAKMAELNNAHSIRATFFILVSSPLYNIFSDESCKALKTIVGHNQNIGLHYHHRGGLFDANRLEREFEALRSVVPDAQPVVAWHNPYGDLSILNEQAERIGFVSAYSRKFMGDGNYISDSNHRNSAQDILSFSDSSHEKLIQILIHPIIWDQPGNSMLETLETLYRKKVKDLDSAFSENSVWSIHKRNTS